MYAVIRTGGKQYRVEPGMTLEVEKLALEPGDRVEFDALAVGEGENITIGAPIVAGTRVVAEVLEQTLGDKIIVATYKAKVRTRRRIGHRQKYTRLAIREIGPATSPARQKATPTAE